MTDAVRATPVLTLALSPGEASALLTLARHGRAVLDADPTVLRAPRQRDAARRAFQRLRALTSGT